MQQSMHIEQIEFSMDSVNQNKHNILLSRHALSMPILTLFSLCFQVYSNTGAEHFGPRRAKRMWESQPFTHPASFDTIALDSAARRTIMRKLDGFASDAEFFRRTGRPHKFGAFLFGPPGTRARH